MSDKELQQADDNIEQAMAMNEIVERVAVDTGVAKMDVLDIVRSLIKVTSAEAAKGRVVRLTGLVHIFPKVHKSLSRSYDVWTGGENHIPERVVIKAKVAPTLRNRAKDNNLDPDRFR